MNQYQKIDTVLKLSHEIRLFLQDKGERLKLQEGMDLEVLIFTLFNLINSKVKDGKLEKDRLEALLKASLNQYMINSNLDLFVQKLEYPARFDSN